MKTSTPNTSRLTPYALKIILFLAFMLNRGHSQTTQIFKDWETFDGTQNMFLTAKTITDGYGSVYVAGATRNANGDYDILITKHNSGGTLVWTDSYDGAGGGDDVGIAMYVDANCNLFLTGTTYTSSTDTQDVIVMKYDSAGAQSWVEVYSGDDHLNDYGTALTVFGDTIYIGGVETDSTDSTDFLFLKYDRSGTFYMARTYDDAGLNDICTGISKTVSAVVLTGGTQTATGWEYQVVMMNAITGSFITQWSSGGGTNMFSQIKGACLDNSGNICLTGTTYSASGYDIYTVVLSSTNLGIVWDDVYTSSGIHSDVGNALVADGNGNLYVTGYTDTSGHGTDFITLKYDDTGALLWAETWSGVADSSDSSKAIVLDNNGYPVITGTSWSGSSQDYYTIKYDDSGALLWGLEFNNKYNLDDQPTDIARDDAGNIIVTGQSRLPDGSWEYGTVKYVEVSITMPIDTDSTAGALKFIANRDQLLDMDGDEIERVLYYGGNTFFMADTMSQLFGGRDNDTTTLDSFQRVDLNFGTTGNSLLPLEKDDLFHNYFLGYLEGGRPGVPLYKALYSPDVWNQIDIKYSSNCQGVKIFFVIKPGKESGDPGDIEMEFIGQDSLFIDSSFDLHIVTRFGDRIYHRPTAYQIDDSDNFVGLGWQPKFSLSGNIATITDIGSYDSDKRILINIGNDDPPLLPAVQQQEPEYSWFFGGAGNDEGTDVTIDPFGNAYIVGTTNDQLTFPIGTGPGFFSSQNGGVDVFIEKYGSAFGTEMNSGLAPTQNEDRHLWTTIWGGTGDDFSTQITFTADWFYATGYTHSPSNSFYTNGSGTAYLQSTLQGNRDAFIIGGTGFDGGLSVNWGTLFGGDGNEEGNTITHDGNNNIFIAGSTSSTCEDYSCSGIANTCFPICTTNVNSIASTFNNANTPPSSTSINGFGDGFFARFRSGDHQLDWSSNYGGVGDDGIYDIGFDGIGNMYFCGFTSSLTSQFPLTTYSGTNTYNQSTNGGGNWDGIIGKFSENTPSSGNLQPVWSTRFGGSGKDFPLCLAIDGKYNLYVAGYTNSIVPAITCGVPSTYGDFPICTTSVSYNQTAFSGTGDFDGFFAEFNSNLELVWSTYYGGTKEEKITGIATDHFDNLYFIGNSQSISSSNIYQSAGNSWYYDQMYPGPMFGNQNAIITGIFNENNQRVWSTYFGEGNTGIEKGNAIAVTGPDLSYPNSDPNHFWYITGTTNAGSPAPPATGWSGYYLTWNPTRCPGTTRQSLFNGLPGSTNQNEGIIARFGYQDPNPIIINRQIESSNNLTVFPNPFSQRLKFIISLDNPSQLLCQLWSISGQKMTEYCFTDACGDFAGELNLDRVPPGIYLFQIKTLNNVFTRKVVKYE